MKATQIHLQMSGLTKCSIRTYKGVLFRVKRMEILPYTTTYPTLTSQSQKDKHYMNLLIWIKCRETVNIKRWSAAAGIKVEREICLLNFSFSKWKSYGGLFFFFFFTTLNKLNTTEPYTGKWLTVNFMFFTSKKEFYINGITEYATFWD